MALGTQVINGTDLVRTVLNSNLTTNSTLLITESVPLKVIKLICYTLVFIIGVIGNTLVFRIVVRRRKLQTVSNYFICNLAAADVAVLTVNLPFRLAYQENDYVWPFGAFLCKIIPMLTFLFITASSATLVLMSLDQRRAVVYPFKTRLTIKQTKMCIVLIWLASIAVTLPLNFFLQIIYRKGKPVCTDVWPSLRFEQTYFVFLFFIQFIIPMGIITTAYTHVCVRLNSPYSISALPLNLYQQRVQRNRKVIKMLIVIVVVNATFTLPYHITWLLSLFGYPDSVAKKFCVLFVIATSAAHPIILGTLSKDFARGFRSYGVLLSCIKREMLTTGSTRRGTNEPFRRSGFKTLSNFSKRSSDFHNRNICVNNEAARINRDLCKEDTQPQQKILEYETVL